MRTVGGMNDQSALSLKAFTEKVNRFPLALQVENSQAFTWQSQLRHRWDEEKRHCYANICDAQLQYSYEYLGNTPRLVITPLTDRYAAPQT